MKGILTVAAVSVLALAAPGSADHVTEEVWAGWSDNYAYEYDHEEVYVAAKSGHIDTDAGVEYVDVMLWVNYTWDMELRVGCTVDCFGNGYAWLEAFDSSTEGTITAATCANYGSCTNGFQECQPGPACDDPIVLYGRVDIPVAYGEELFIVHSHVYHGYDEDGLNGIEEDEKETYYKFANGALTAGAVAPPGSIVYIHPE